MALRAGYYGLKTRDRSKLFDLLDSVPEGLSPENPIASKNDVLTSIDLLDDTVGWTGKSIVPNNASTPAEPISNVTITVNADKSVTLDTNGQQASASVNFTLLNWFTGRFEEGVKYRVSDVNGSFNCYTYVPKKKGVSGTPVYNIDTSGSVAGREYFTYKSSEYDYYAFGIFVRSGAILDNVTLYPMISKADIYELDPTYEPYHDTVTDMFAKVINLALTITTDNYTGDIDDLDAGIRYCTNAAAHNPGNAWGYCITIKNPSNKIQLFIGQASTGIWYRRFASSAWQAWNVVTLTEVTANREEETKKATKKKVIKEEE